MTTFQLVEHAPGPVGTMSRIGGYIVRELASELRRHGERIERRAVTQYMTAGAKVGLGNAHPTKLSRRSGALVRSLSHEVQGLTLTVGSDARYARLHEKAEPETLTPKTHKYMRMATEHALTPGTGQLTAAAKRELASYRATGESRLRFVPFKRGVDSGGTLRHEKTGEVWFVLKPKVTTVKRPYLLPAIDDTDPDLERAIHRVVRQPFEAPRIELRTATQIAMGGA